MPTIQEKLADNGSPRATFETTEERLAFLIHIPVHPQCNKQLVVREDEQNHGSEKTSPSSEKSSEKNGLGSEKSSEKTSPSSEKSDESSEKPQDIIQTILDAIRNNSKVSAAEIAMKLGVSARAVEKRIRFLRESGVIRRVGPNKGGSWEIINET